MASSFTPSQIKYFRREATRLQRSMPGRLIRAQALDKIAQNNGFERWSLLQKHSEKTSSSRLKKSRKPFIFSRTPELMREALRKVPEPRWSTRSEAAQRLAVDISVSFVSALNAVEYAIDYLECLLTVPRFLIHTTSPIYWEMHAWMPYEIKEIAPGIQIIVNRKYKPVGQASKEWAIYENSPHLHVRLTECQIRQSAARSSSPSYLFNDGCPPWESRVDAYNYLERLKVLRGQLMG